MCGIAGFIDFGRSIHQQTLHNMVSVLRHRGPDDRGMEMYRGPVALVGLGHARLSIVDLTRSGHQPMVHDDLSVVFNGELYNFREIRKELEVLGHVFDTQSDTEVLLHAYLEWGIACIDRFIGMFAFCLYDASEQSVFLVRDRAGVKPLYIFQSNEVFLFASELKAFHQCSAFSAQVDTNRVNSYFNHGFIPDEQCIFKHCHKVNAGEVWRVDLRSRNVEKRRYWSVHDCYSAQKLEMDYSEAMGELKNVLLSACQYRTVSDVPIGVFLSGGYDSTAVAAILQSGSVDPINTFTIGFSEGNDEAPYARETAQRLGTNHHELYCSEQEAQQVIPTLPDVFDEPFADSSAIPTIMVSQMARRHVKVALSADAGDEVFCGYDSYRLLHQRMARITMIPSSVRPVLRASGRAVLGLIPPSWHAIPHKLHGLFAALEKNDSFTGQKLHVIARQLPSYLRDNILAVPVNADFLTFEPQYEDDSNGVERSMAHDYESYLKDDILVKVDRASMSVGLEGREPLIDHRLIEFVARLPFEYKYHKGVGKRILKDVVHQYVPKDMLDRPKAGFSLPIYKWLRGDLSWLLDEYCSPQALRESGFLNERFLTRQLAQFRRNKLHYSPIIWRLLMMQMWIRKWTTAARY